MRGIDERGLKAETVFPVAALGSAGAFCVLPQN
jgi:hypothetical protein